MSKRVLLIVGFVFLVTVGWYLLQLLGPSPAIVVSPETTYLTAPLADDGLPDYARYVLNRQRAGVTPENNAAIPLLQAMWPVELSPGDQRLLCTELGMPIPTANGLDPEEPAAILGEESEDLLAQAQERPWNAKQFPELASWIEQNAAAYALIELSAARDQFYLPSPSLLGDPDASLSWRLVPHVDACRRAVDCLRLRAMLRLGEASPDAAWNDLAAAEKLASWIDDGSPACRGTSYRVLSTIKMGVLRLLADKSLTAELGETILRQPPNAPPAPFEDSLELDRLSTITTILNLAEARRSVDDELADFTFDDVGWTTANRALAIDWNRILRQMNEIFDQLARCLEMGDRRARATAIDDVQRPIWMAAFPVRADHEQRLRLASTSITERSDLVADLLAALMMESWSAVTNDENERLARQRLLQTAAALAVYRVREGAYPESLNDLAPALLPQAPRDLCGTGPLRYTRTPDGYLLVDTGLNGVDDGGSSSGSCYKGHRFGRSYIDEVAILELLGESAELDESGRLLQDLDDRIPAGADDWSIRVPLLPPPWLTTDEPSGQSDTNSD